MDSQLSEGRCQQWTTTRVFYWSNRRSSSTKYLHARPTGDTGEVQSISELWKGCEGERIGKNGIYLRL